MPPSSSSSKRPSINRVQPSLLRSLNERAVFEYILAAGETSRIEIAKTMQISPATVSKLVSNLQGLGLVEIGNAETGGSGRPALTVAPSRTAQVIGAAIGVDQTAVVSAGLDGVIRDQVEFKNPGRYPALIDRLVGAARRLMPDPDDARTLGLGISTPGQVDRNRQRVWMSPNLHLLDGRPLARDVADKLPLGVVMFHETDGTCLAEMAYGSARNLENFVMVGVYEGFGASIVAHGRLLSGSGGMAGEIGHFPVQRDGKRCGCGNRGCLETVATDPAFAAAVSARVGRPMALPEILDACQRGEIDVAAELEETLAYLAMGIGGIINVTNPQAVLVCTRLFDFADDVMDRLTDAVHRHALPPLMKQCRLIRAQGDCRQGAVAGITRFLVDSLGPALN